MFVQLFFILLTLSLINFNAEIELKFWIIQPFLAFKWALFGYIGLLTGLFVQAKLITYPSVWKRLHDLWIPLINFELLTFLSIYHFGLGAQRFFLQDSSVSYHTPFIVFSLVLYFFALGWAQMWEIYFNHSRSFQAALRLSWQKLSFFCPFCVPFIVISLILDFFEFIRINYFYHLPLNQDIFLPLFILFILGSSLIFLPPLMMKCWRCQPLKPSQLKERLEKICQILHFKHAGLKRWPLMGSTLTAGIIGVVPLFRYVLFTPSLLKRFKIEEIEAILIHEIGHSRYKHLLFYPFIMLGMLVIGALSLFWFESILEFIIKGISEDFIQYVFFAGLFALYALILWLYFRFIFGFFSRLFERQADLFIFESPLPPFYMVQALDRLGIESGYTHFQPSWHHFSLQERMRFLDQAIENPKLVRQHHQRVKKWLIFYFCFLCFGIIYLYYIM